MKYQIVVIAILLRSVVAMADIILVDFDDAAGTPAGWNSASPIYMGTPLLFSDGTDSGAEIFGSPWVSGLETAEAGAFAVTAPWAAEAAQDFYHGNSSSYFIRLINLDANALYTIELISSAGSSYGGWFTVNGAFADNNPDGDYFWSYGDGYINGTVMVWSNISPAPDASLTLNVQRGDPRSYLAVNAMRIMVIPEPQTLLLGISGIGILLILTTRKNTQPSPPPYSSPAAGSESGEA